MPDTFPKPRLLLIWATSATLAAVVLAAVAFWFFVRTRQLTAEQQRSETAAMSSVSSASPFPGLRDSDVPGRYRWFHAGVDGGTIQLNADHTFVNKDGKILPKYRWELSRDGLVIIWQSGQISRFAVMERPVGF